MTEPRTLRELTPERIAQIRADFNKSCGTHLPWKTWSDDFADLLAIAAQPRDSPTVESLQRIIDQQNREREAIIAENKRNYDELLARSQPQGAREALTKAAEAALGALRSYQYGNASPDLAKEVADFLSVALKGTR